MLTSRPMMDTEKHSTISYSSPPVAEVAIGVQFARLQAFTGAHVGWFWKTVLDPSGDTWIKAKTAARIEDQFERFGADRKWGIQALKLLPGDEPERVQILDRSNERMVQIQDSRVVYNWRKGEGAYPSYDDLLPAFEDCYQKFSAFAGSSGLGDLEENQWEVTYVNHIPKGGLWNEPEDWPRIFPRLYVPPASSVVTGIDAIGGQWQLNLASDAGRLYVSMHHGRTGGPDGPEVLVLQLTARGPVDANKGQALSGGLSLGHRAIVDTFDAMTSAVAHEAWGRQG